MHSSVASVCAANMVAAAGMIKPCTMQVSRDGSDNDDYFHSAAELPCIPDVPDSLKSESDSVDLDELPCIVPDDMMPLEPVTVEASMSDPDKCRMPAAQPRSGASPRLEPAAASITRSELFR